MDVLLVVLLRGWINSTSARVLAIPTTPHVTPVNHHPIQVMPAARAGGTFKSSPEPGKNKAAPVGR